MKESSVIYFALMDHDVMFQNEVAGQAFWPLNKLPGLRGEETKNFAGLKEVTLPLIHPKLMGKFVSRQSTSDKRISYNYAVYWLKVIEWRDF